MLKHNGHLLDFQDLERPSAYIEPEPDLMREREESIVNWFENVFHILNAYQSHQKSARQLRMSTRAMELALGFRLAAGADGPAELARRCRVGKHTFGKCMNHFIEQLKLSPLPFQRKAEARAAMQVARYNQVGAKRAKCKLCSSQFVTKNPSENICPLCAEKLRKESEERKNKGKAFEDDKFRKPTLYEAKQDYEGPGHHTGKNT